MHFDRRFGLVLLPGLLLGATVWALSFGTLPPADLTFCNGTEIKTIDPAAVTGMPEGRVISALFEGLLQRNPVDLTPQAGMAERWSDYRRLRRVPD